MPGGDGTGPQGKGPRTGRGLGPCPTVAVQPRFYMGNMAFGRGLANRRRYGRKGRV